MHPCSPRTDYGDSDTESMSGDEWEPAEFTDEVVWMLQFLNEHGYSVVAESIVQMLDDMADEGPQPEYYY